MQISSSANGRMERMLIGAGSQYLWHKKSGKDTEKAGKSMNEGGALHMTLSLLMKIVAV